MFDQTWKFMWSAKNPLEQHGVWTAPQWHKGTNQGTNQPTNIPVLEHSTRRLKKMKEDETRRLKYNNNQCTDPDGQFFVFAALSLQVV